MRKVAIMMMIMGRRKKKRRRKKNSYNLGMEKMSMFMADAQRMYASRR